MLTVIIPALNAGRDLQALLAALVPAAVEGLVRDVVVADGGSTDETPALCEDAGAVLLTGGLVEAARLARCERLLILPPELRLPHDWARRLSEHLARGGEGALVVGQTDSLWGKLTGKPFGLMISRTEVEAGATLASLRRRLGPAFRIG